MPGFATGCDGYLQPFMVMCHSAPLAGDVVHVEKAVMAEIKGLDYPFCFSFTGNIFRHSGVIQCRNMRTGKPSFG